MSRARELADLGNNAGGLETLTVSDITDLSVSASNINSATNQITDSSTDLNVDSNTLVVDKSENKVGIGTTDPNGKLTSATSKDATALSIVNTTATTLGTEKNYISFYGTNNSSNLITTPLAQIGAQSNNGSYQQGDLVFKTSPFNGSSTERMRIDSSGSITTPNGEFNGTIGSSASFPSGTIINYKFVEIGVYELSGTYTPFNISTAGTYTQGMQVVSTSFTPKSDNSKIFCQAQLYVQEDSNSSDYAMAALFVHTDNLSQQINNDRADGSYLEHVVATLSGEYTNSSTSAKTIQVRVSGDTSEAIDVNCFNKAGAKNTSGYIRTGLSIFEVQQ